MVGVKFCIQPNILVLFAFPIRSTIGPKKKKQKKTFSVRSISYIYLGPKKRKEKKLGIEAIIKLFLYKYHILKHLENPSKTIRRPIANCTL